MRQLESVDPLVLTFEQLYGLPKDLKLTDTQAHSILLAIFQCMLTQLSSTY